MNKLVKLLNKKERGFTLIELIVVIGILAILAVIAIPAISGYFNNAKIQADISNAKIVYNAESAYLASNPTATTTIDVATLVTNKYLANTPKTSKGNDYTVSDLDADGNFTVGYDGNTYP